MVIILDTQTGEALNFKTRKEAGQYLKVSLPTLRGWLRRPFFLYHTYIITSTGNGKIERSREALYKVQAIRDGNISVPQEPSTNLENEYSPKITAIQ